MMSVRRFYFVLLFIGMSSVMKSQEPLDSIQMNLFAKVAALSEEVLELVTWEKGRHTMSIYPTAGYSPRTGLTFGIMPVWQINQSKTSKREFDRPSTISPSFSFSLDGMYDATVDVLAFTKYNFLIISKFQYLFLPDKFYGLGNQVKAEPFAHYNLDRFSLEVDMLKGVNSRWFAGLRVGVNYDEFSAVNGDDLNASVVGYEGGWVNNLGPVVAYDTRNSPSYPSKGAFVLGSTVWSLPVLGSDYRYSFSKVDARKYISLRKDKTILALQAFVSHSKGEVPFYKLSYIGAKDMLRGIPHPYKYLDNDAWFTQLEFRQHLWWRLGMVAFAGTGRVMPNLLSDTFDELHCVGGGGLRFQVLPNDGLNFRIDYGVSNHNESGVFFTIREAF